MKRSYQVLPPTAPVPAPDDLLEQTVREGAQHMLEAALRAEVDNFLGRVRYQRGEEFREYRNGYLPERSIGVGMGAVTVRQPRVRDIPEGMEPFQSACWANGSAGLGPRPGYWSGCIWKAWPQATLSRSSGLWSGRRQRYLPAASCG